ncbi:prolyl aminopeptidase [Methylovorus glucosotrophus]|uniref:Proline iminopeptidase n=1 Tax=Methylovorus glucosotrophus (strain SIP3-4) TaxID=582744 RepID=C6XA50_METGS|nr:prolyl aminopeptidase [Methylovorus glucosotrophus]ACT51591.1 proline iminopeptidase [Methylovorus glucosotrophus SIP3-4]
MNNSHTYNLFPEILPYRSDWLNVSARHQIYFEECGNPAGPAVVFLHGGPGSGCNPAQRRYFDPAHYRIILLDQRGCGRSHPHGGTEENTTDLLVSDIEQLREHLGIDRWLVFGGSWGSTLALCYAIAHSDKVRGLILRGIFLSRPSELDWFLGDVKHFYPEAWQKLLAYLPEEDRGDVLQAYGKLVFNDDPAISAPAATRWNAFEGSIMTLLPGKNEGSASNEVQIARARVQIHYIKNLCFVGQRDLLQEAKALAHIPTVIVQGRYDMVCPPISAYELHAAMPHAALHMVPDAGHSGMEAGTLSALVAATEEFKKL